jgi:hypothetical protein
VADLLEDVFAQLGYWGASGLVRAGAVLPPGATDRVWSDLQAKTGIEAAYFHGNTPLVAFSTVDRLDSAADIRRRLWNLSRVPILIAASERDVAAYSCLVPPTGGTAEQRARLGITSSSNVLGELGLFSRTALEAGEPMSRFKNRFRRGERVDRHLLENLRELRRQLIADENRDHSTINALLGRSIFVRYFEDRSILTPDHCVELCGVRTFEDALRSGVAKTFELFAALSGRFNGDLFAVDPNEAINTTDGDLALLSEFFRATVIAGGQRSFWPYDFSIIPPELISAIYEQLLEERQDEDAAYYTPRPLVDLILDEVLPWDGDARPVTILDPACGSGIFLTETFRRLLYRRFERGGETPTFAALVDILTSSIFGVDINRDALRVAALGLYLALLEQLDPPSAWRDAHFPRLEDASLIESDFFDEHRLVGKTFDIVVGNPPWKNALTSLARAFVDDTGMVVGDDQIAIAFVRRAEQFLAQDGTLGMLLPAKGLLHNRSPRTVRARFDLFERLRVDTIVDLTNLRRGLFTKAIAPCAVMVAHLSAPVDEAEQDKSNGVLHVVPRPSPLQRALDGFLVSTDDVKVVGAALAGSVPDIWKTYLRGSSRDAELIRRLRGTYPTLEAVAEDRGWITGMGGTLGRGGSPSDHLIGLPIIPYDRIRPLHVSGVQGRLFGGEFEVVTTRTMERPRDPLLYRAPHLLARRTASEGRLAAVLLDFNAFFNNTMVGIAVPEKDRNLLELAEAYLNSSLARWYQLLTCSTWGVERSAIETNEILSLPFAVVSGREARSIASTVRRIKDEPGNLSAMEPILDELVFKAYGLSESEQDLVRDTLRMFEFPESELRAIDVSDERTSLYAGVLRAALLPVDEGVRVNVDRLEGLPHYLVATVTFGEGEARLHDQLWPVLATSFDEAISSGRSPVTIIQPSLIVLQDSSAYLVKPDHGRYWSATRAREDAGEVLGAIVTIETERPS